MKAPWSGQLSAAKTGWLLALLFFGWLAYFFIPAPKPEPKPLPSVAKPPPSRLVALGLPDNPDFEHLPEFFALYADKAEWKNDKAIFAYWNPGSNSYSYFFEARRQNDRYVFMEIEKPLADEVMGESKNKFYWGDDVPKEAMIRFMYTYRPIRSPTIGSGHMRWTPTKYDRGLPDFDFEQTQKIVPPPVTIDLKPKG